VLVGPTGALAPLPRGWHQWDVTTVELDMGVDDQDRMHGWVSAQVVAELWGRRWCRGALCRDVRQKGTGWTRGQAMIG
jgi:hypothetical protein